MVPSVRVFGNSFHGLEVNIDESEAHAISFGPFEVVQDGPVEIAADIGAIGDRLSEGGQMSRGVVDSWRIVDFAILMHPVHGGTAIFGDVDGLRVALREHKRSPIEDLRFDGPVAHCLGIANTTSYFPFASRFVCGYGGSLVDVQAEEVHGLSYGLEVLFESGRHVGSEALETFLRVMAEQHGIRVPGSAEKPVFAVGHAEEGAACGFDCFRVVIGGVRY